MKTKGNDWSEAFPMLFVAWIINFILFTFIFWVGDFLRIEKNMGWMELAQSTSLGILMLTKMILSVGIIASLLSRFKVIQKIKGKGREE